MTVQSSAAPSVIEAPQPSTSPSMDVELPAAHGEGKLQGSGPHLIASSMHAPPVEPSRLEKRVVGVMVRAIFFRGRRGRKRALPDRFDAVKLTFAGNNGATLVADHVRAASPRGIVVLAHPDRRYGRHWFARQGWLDWLLEEGYDALAFDFAVYGDSRGGSTYLHEDVMAACAEARRLRPGLPVHVVALSIGAFAAINALPHLQQVDSVSLESPYPTFDSWYEESGGSKLGWVNKAMGRIFPKTYARIDARQNISMATGPRILIAGTRDDAVTPIVLTRRVAEAAPEATYLEVDGAEHLHLFDVKEYRQAVLRNLRGM